MTKDDYATTEQEYIFASKKTIINQWADLKYKRCGDKEFERLKVLFEVLLEQVLNGLEMMTTYYSYSNGEISICISENLIRSKKLVREDFDQVISEINKITEFFLGYRLTVYEARMRDLERGLPAWIWFDDQFWDENDSTVESVSDNRIT